MNSCIFKVLKHKDKKNFEFSCTYTENIYQQKVNCEEEDIYRISGFMFNSSGCLIILRIYLKSFPP